MRPTVHDIAAEAGVSLATRSDVGMPGDARKRDGGVALHGGGNQASGAQILCVGEGFEVTAFKFNANREVIAARAAVKTAFARMPGALQ